MLFLLLHRALSSSDIVPSSNRTYKVHSWGPLSCTTHWEHTVTLTRSCSKSSLYLASSTLTLHLGRLVSLPHVLLFRVVSLGQPSGTILGLTPICNASVRWVFHNHACTRLPTISTANSPCVSANTSRVLSAYCSKCPSVWGMTHCLSLSAISVSAKTPAVKMMTKFGTTHGSRDTNGYNEWTVTH